MKCIKCILVVLRVVFLNGVYCPWVPDKEDKVASAVGTLYDDVWTMMGPDKKHPDYCPLQSSGVYPYMIKIWLDTPDANVFVRTGVLFTHRAVLTTCHGFSHGIMADYKLYAQRVFKVTGKQHELCFQTRKILEWYKHPNCIHYPEERPSAFWNFQVLVVDEMFYAEKQFAYPTLPIHKQAYDLLLFIRRVSILHDDDEGCEIPTFQDLPYVPYPVLSYTGKVDTRMIEGMCIKAVCDPHFANPKICVPAMKQLLDHTFLCVQPKFIAKIPSETIPSWMGSPLICNNSAVGILTGDIIRPDAPRDWYFITTLLRIWPWLMSFKAKYWDKMYNRAGSWDSPFLEQHLWRWYQFTTPRFDKNIDRDMEKQFRIRIPADHKKKSRSGGDRLYMTFTVFSAFLSTLMMLI